MRGIRLLVAVAVLGVAALAAAGTTSAHDICRYAPYNGHACIRYGDHALGWRASLGRGLGAEPS
jgi:hypothetical protein